VLWDGKPTGRFGKAAAFSAQSYKLLDGGEGGLMVTDDKEIAYKAMLHAGCYERNWQKHFGTAEDAAWIDGMVNALPAYNFRMSNLSAAVLLPQIERIDDRVAHYNANYERLASQLATNPAIRMPKFLDKVRPAADSIQFELTGLPVEKMEAFVASCKKHGVDVAVFGVGGKNARCYWNWTFFEPNDCPKTKAMLLRTADLRLPLRYTSADMDRIAGVISDAVAACQS
jgi:dTDP-4-amino-4,6-dideoxygalactose transaminase